MAASSSSQQPQQVVLSSNLGPPPKSGKKGLSRKGKGKENVARPAQRQGDLYVDVNIETEESVIPWDWVPLTDRSASKVPPIFTRDGSYFFSLVGSSIKIYSVTTGEVVSTLSSPPASDDRLSSLLTTAIINPHNNFQLITGSLDGRVMVWDFLDAALLKIIDIGQPIHYMCAHENFKDSVFVAASRSNKKAKVIGIDDNAAVLRISLRTGGATTKSAEIHAIGKTRFPTGLAFSKSGAWLIATAGHKVYIASSSSLASGFTKYVSPERLTCLAPHPFDEYFATGDEKGNIRLWYCLSDGLPTNARGVEKKTQTTTFHWHAHAVASIAFTANGAYLLSGGEESVLVIWQLNTGKKEFVPRVGAPINTVSLSNLGGNEEEYLLGLADATYLFVNAGTLKVSRSFSHIKLGSDTPSTSKLPSTPLALHNLTSNVLLPSSHPSSLQLYSLSSSKIVSELEISPSNRISRRDEKLVEVSRVEQVAISASGEWMASVDARDEEDGFRGEIYLKLWKWDQKETWTLNTRVDRPHGATKVTCLAFSPSPPKDTRSILLVTTGADGNVKMWGLKLVNNEAGIKEEFWVIRSMFGFQSEVPQSVTWSPDASLLAVSVGSFVSVYNSNARILRQTFNFPECKQISSAHFIGRGGRFLIVVGKHDLILWDLVTQSVRWNHKTLPTIDLVVPHPQDHSFTVFYNYPMNNGQPKTIVSIFHVWSSVPSAVHSIPFLLRNVSPHLHSMGRSNYSFIGITQDWHLIQFGDDCKLVKEGGSIARGLSPNVTLPRRTLFQDIFGKSAFAEASTPSFPLPETNNSSGFRVGMEGSSVFENPAYLMPPLEHLFDSLMGRFLVPRDHDEAQSLVMEAEEQDMDTNEDIGYSVISGADKPRMVTQQEMEGLVTIFQRHTVTSHLSGVKSQPLDIIKSRKNAESHSSDSPLKATGPLNTTPHLKISNPRPDSVMVSPSVSTTNGRKRKNTSS